MKSDRSRVIDETVLAELPAGDHYDGAGTRVLCVTLHFFDRRGYYLSANVEERRGRMTSFGLFAGVPSQIVEPAARFNARKLASITIAPEVLSDIKARMLAKHEASEDKRAAERERANGTR